MSVASTEAKAVWRLRCGCGSETGVISEALRFVFRCVGCDRETLFLDLDQHGEAAEIARFEGYRTNSLTSGADTDLEQVNCPGCGASRLTATVTVTYHDERIWEWQDDPNFPLADCFNVFRLDCRCLACGHSWESCTIDTKP
jgi:hypothetical protein